ncbi:hypothetical protein GUJ93_ZPchr0458g22607 [Zizania palustris]|uniref:Peptidase C1A papain C-terminal domain-containing protein n=1 Tax=Zizania palustris TaxID=103762 RepID=A0A8J5UZV2_ZIZPA|nr:hypothetical protein GUJ93_ZPchr0458g22607 [Zizania palustris]
MSEQQVLDCEPSQDLGCLGGWIGAALLWIKSHDITTEDCWPYDGRLGFCTIHTCAWRRKFKIKEVMAVYPVGSEEAFAWAVARQPVAVTISANETNLQFYNKSSGVYTGPCTGELNHAVVVVGYTRDAISGMDCWILKNSWGPKWGDNGFFYMRKGADGRNGLCGIVKANGFYPVPF